MGGKISIRRVYRTRPAVTTAILHRHGAEAARRAHNPEDLGSKPSVGIYHHIAMVHQGTGANPNRCGAVVSARGS